MRKIVSFVSLVSLTLVVIHDSSFRFERERVLLKRANKSAQRHWSLFYNQEYIYFDTSFRYLDDIAELESIISAGSVVLSDIATSYFLAAHSDVIVPNIHRHHGRKRLPRWDDLLNKKIVCGLEHSDNLTLLKDFIRNKDGDIPQIGAEFRYIILNKDQKNLNLRWDCISQTRTSFVQNIEGVAKIVYDGEFLRVYEILR